MTDKHWRTAAFTLGVCVVAAAFFILGGKVNSAEDTADTNQQAIEKSCIILSNVLIQATGETQQEPNQIIISEILRQADESGRPWVRDQFQEALKDAGNIDTLAPNCKKIAQDPESIKRLPKPTATKEGEQGG